ncbi:MAG TPA: hypothetical protein VFQ22_09325 [Longimicrobiales bacterium]|nr:hypothetical protein [Longimicrobiales bacterium]
MASRRMLVATSILVLGAPAAAAAQDLADLDYERLSFRGIGLDAGWVWPRTIDPAVAFGARFDLGYAGPGLRIVPRIGFWSSDLEDEEVTELEDRIASLVADQTGGPPPAIDLGRVRWRDYSVGVDAHIVWDSLFDLLTYGGLGVSAHILDGDGDAIAGTFVEDLLDSVSAGLNLHFGFEYPVAERHRVYTVGSYEVLTEFQVFSVRVGWQYMFGPNAPGEGR